MIEDPLASNPLLSSVDLMKEIASDNDHLLTLLKKIIMTKLDGYASEIDNQLIQSTTH